MTQAQSVLVPLLRCVWIGLAAGFIRSALHPLKAPHPVLFQLLFCMALLPVWAVTVFGVCRADPRAGFLLGCAGGYFLWIRTAGPGTEAVFSWFWNLFAQWMRWFPGMFLWIFHKLAIFRKFLFPRGRK